MNSRVLDTLSTVANTMDLSSIDPNVIRYIAGYLPTPYHVAQLRRVSRGWRMALADLARISRISPRALLTYAVAHGDANACIGAQETGASILARFAHCDVTDDLRVLWMGRS